MTDNSTEEHKEWWGAFMFMCSEIMMQAAASGHSMAQIELDPAKHMGLNLPEGAGEILIVLAAGPSISKLRSGLEIANNLN